MSTALDVRRKWIAIWMKILGKPLPVKVVELGFASTSTRIPLRLMQKTPIPMGQRVTFKYFTEEETKGLWNDLVFKLDRARELFGSPITITSGYRDPEKNKDVGGVKDSAHTTGKAVDIRAPVDQQMREKLCWALGAAGFRRIGMYTRHFHCDIDQDKPNPSVWFGESH